MKRINLLILLLGVMVLSSFNNQLFKTSLKVSVRNELGNIEEKVKVCLYKTEEDYNASENPVQCGETDKKGNVTFENLETISYFVSAEKGDMNNFGAGEKTEEIKKEKLNKATIIISE